jgi:hypothetical protein
MVIVAVNCLEKYPPYLYRPVMQVVRRGRYSRTFLGLGAGLVCSLSLGSCRVLRPGGCVRDRGGPGRRSRRPQGVLDAPVWERIMLGGKGQGGGVGGAVRGLAVQVGAFLSGGVTKPVMPGPGGWEQPALPGSAGRGGCPGDKMIDWVSPPAGMRPLSLTRKLGPGWARGSEPWPKRRQGWRLALVVPAGSGQGMGSAAAPGPRGKGSWSSAGC